MCLLVEDWYLVVGESDAAAFRCSWDAIDALSHWLHALDTLQPVAASTARATQGRHKPRRVGPRLAMRAMAGWSGDLHMTHTSHSVSPARVPTRCHSDTPRALTTSQLARRLGRGGLVVGSTAGFPGPVTRGGTLRGGDRRGRGPSRRSGRDGPRSDPHSVPLPGARAAQRHQLADQHGPRLHPPVLVLVPPGPLPAADAAVRRGSGRRWRVGVLRRCSRVRWFALRGWPTSKTHRRSGSTSNLCTCHHACVRLPERWG